MRDKNIATIVHLASLLEVAQTDLENANDALERTHDEARQDRDRLYAVESDLRRANREIESLNNRLGNSPEHYNLRSQAEVFRAIMGNPERFMKAIEWLRSPEGISERLAGQKLAMIKMVREKGEFGLKEAKDLVEYYIQYPHEPVGCCSAC